MRNCFMFQDFINLNFTKTLRQLVESLKDVLKYLDVSKVLRCKFGRFVHGPFISIYSKED